MSFKPYSRTELERMKERSIQELKHIEICLKKISTLELDEEDPWEDGAVLSFSAKTRDIIYDYVFIKCAGLWYGSGTRFSTTSLSWKQFCTFVHDSGVDAVFAASEWEQVY